MGKVIKTLRENNVIQKLEKAKAIVRCYVILCSFEKEITKHQLTSIKEVEKMQDEFYGTVISFSKKV